MGLDWLLAVAAWLPLPYLAWIATRAQGAMFAPGPLAAWAWVGAAGLPLFLAPDLPVHPSAYALVLLFIFVSVVGTTAGASAVRVVPVRTRRAIAEERWYPVTLRLCWFGTALGFVAAILLYRHTRTFVTSESLVEIAMYTSMGRYDGSFTVPLPVRLLTCGPYLAAALSAFVVASTPAHERQWLRAFAWLMPVFVVMLVHTTKASVLYGFVFWAAGWTAGCGYDPSPPATSRKGWGLKIALVVFALAASLVLAQGLRMNRMSFSEIPFLLGHLRIYAVGHMPVFGDWVVTALPLSACDGYGTHTFAGLADLAGIAERKQGLYEGTASFTESNIYTTWRPLIEDFGIVGAVLFLLVVAFGTGAGWRMLQGGNLRGAAFVVPFAAYILWSPIAPIFAYSTLVAVAVMFGAWSWWAARITETTR